MSSLFNLPETFLFLQPIGFVIFFLVGFWKCFLFKNFMGDADDSKDLR